MKIGTVRRMLFLKAPLSFQATFYILVRCRQNLVEEMTINIFSLIRIFMKIGAVEAIFYIEL